MKCPYCQNKMEEGSITFHKVPLWLKSGEKKGISLNVKRHFLYNEISGYKCKRCNKIIINI